MKNNSFEEIAGVLKGGRKILIFTHQNMDGDAVGSSAALAGTLRKMGKECHVILPDDQLPDNLSFLDRGLFAEDPDIIPDPDLGVMLDLSDPHRFPRGEKKFLSCPVKICVDHHMIDQVPWDWHYIDSKAAATGELVYKLILALGAEPDAETAEALFAAITTDTGNFQYSNTTQETHRIAAALYDCGGDFARVSSEIYENERMEHIILQGKILSGMRFLAGGKLAVSKVTQKLLAETGAVLSDAEGAVNEMRKIRGVEIAAFLKESGDGRTFISLRSKNQANVQQIAAGFGGGGHIRAAGATVHMPVEEAEEMVVRACEDYLSES